ncbi:MAG TPA: four helix bundle protein [Terracidiphilus sp.]|nr:four helix bundle protein [Terracidiphilus sp.]
MEQVHAVRNGVRTRYYRDLVVWQKAMELARAIYHETASLPKTEMFGIQAQMRRAAVSVPSNVAEGHGRLDDGHFRQFLATARGSLFELQTQLELSRDLKFISEASAERLMGMSEEVARLINGLLKSMEVA